VNVTDFLERVDTLDPKPVYLFCPHKAPRAREGTFEPVLALRAVDRLVARFIDPSLADLAYSSYHADETDPGEIVETAETLPFLAERRVILVRKAEAYEGDTSSNGKGRSGRRPVDRLLAYLDRPCESTILLFVAERMDRRSKFYKACDKSGEIVECPELREHEALLWARREIESQGKQVQAAALTALIARTGTRLSDVENAIRLLVSYLGERETLEETDVVAACSDVHEENAWGLTDAIARSDTKEALRVLREIVQSGANEFQILGQITWLLRSAYGVAAGGEAGRQVKPFVAGKVRPLAEKLGLAKFRDAFALCTETDLLMRSTGVDRVLALELLVVKLATPRGGRRSG